jgi:hypothetical protein
MHAPVCFQFLLFSFLFFVFFLFCFCSGRAVPPAMFGVNSFPFGCGVAHRTAAAAADAALVGSSDWPATRLQRTRSPTSAACGLPVDCLRNVSISGSDADAAADAVSVVHAMAQLFA